MVKYNICFFHPTSPKDITIKVLLFVWLYSFVFIGKRLFLRNDEFKSRCLHCRIDFHLNIFFILWIPSITDQQPKPGKILCSHNLPGNKFTSPSSPPKSIATCNHSTGNFNQIQYLPIHPTAGNGHVFAASFVHLTHITKCRRSKTVCRILFRDPTIDRWSDR